MPLDIYKLAIFDLIGQGNTSRLQDDREQSKMKYCEAI